MIFSSRSTKKNPNLSLIHIKEKTLDQDSIFFYFSKIKIKAMDLIPHQPNKNPNSSIQLTPPSLSRYENQKRRDWNTFCQYLRNHRPPLSLPSCSGAHVLEFLRYLDQFGKTKVHHQNCAFFGLPNPPAPCPCPLRQAWGSLDALIGRLRAAYEENGGPPEANPFGSRAVRLYLREVRDFQAKARGVSYQKKRKRIKRLITQGQTQTHQPLSLQQQQQQQPQQGQSLMASYSGATV